MRSAWALAAVSLALAACGKLQDFGGTESPLATFQVTFTGDLAPLRPAGDDAERSLQVALVWGAQWLQEPLCILTPESDAVATVLAAGCRDALGFVPKTVHTSVPITIGEVTSLPLLTLPTADLLVGSVTERVGYASFVVYDDRDGSNTLELSQSHGTPYGAEGGGGGGQSSDDVADSRDVIYGASFVTMTEPDQRAAYREGGFDESSAFYPRSGCGSPPAAGNPPAGFSVLAAGGFTAAAAAAATASGGLPAEDPAACSEALPPAKVVTIAARAPADLAEVDCDEQITDGSTRYHEPPSAEPDWTGRVTACAHLPSFDASTQSSVIQLIVSGRSTDTCKGLTHYLLRGCRGSASCSVPDWDITSSAPSWWPCSQ